MPAFKPFRPILADLWRDRKWAFAVCAAGGVQVSLVSAGLPGWPCPLMTATGIPCPGCGLTRAVIELIHGDWHAALTIHAFAPLLLLALLLTGLSVLLPARYKLPLVSLVEMIERRTGATAIGLIGLIGYWLVRLLFFPEVLTRAVRV